MASVKELENQLREAGTKLVSSLPATSDELLQLLDQVETFLSKVDQAPSESTQAALSPLLKALVADQLLMHTDIDVRVSVSACLSEITRISAPEAPYEDNQMREVFKLIVSSFENLSEISSQSYAKRLSILETVAKVRSCVVMLDLECDALILEMFKHFLRAIRDYHPENVFESMETIMTLVLEESEDISPELLSPLLDTVKKDNNEVLPVAQKLAEKVLKTCAAKLRTWLVQAVKSLGITVDDYSEVVASICQESPDTSDLNGTHNPSKQRVYQEEETEVAPSEPVDPAAEKPPKPVISNGITQAGDKDAIRDTSFLKNGDRGFNDPSKAINISSEAEPQGVGSAKVEDESQSEETTRTSASKPTSSGIPDVSHVDEEKVVEKELDNETRDKEFTDKPGNVKSQEKEVPNEVDSDKDEDKADLSEPDSDSSPGKEVSSEPDEVPNEVDSDKDEDKAELSEPDSDKSPGKVVSSEPDGEETLIKEVLRKSDGDKNLDKEVPSKPGGDKTLDKEVGVSPEDAQGKQDPCSPENQEADEEVPNPTIKKPEKEVPNSPDIEQDEEKDVPSSSDSERTLDDKLGAEKFVPTESEDENAVQSSSPKKLEDQYADNLTLSPSETLNEKISRKAVCSNKKQSLKKTAVTAYDEGKKVSQATSDMGRGRKRRTSKTSPVGVPGASKSPATADFSKERKKGDQHLRQSGKENFARSSAKEDGKKRGREKIFKDDKKTVSEDERSSSEKDAQEETRSPSKSSKKSSEDDTQLVKKLTARSKGKGKASDVKKYGENLVGARIKVFWPEDVEYYPGKVESFDASEKKHRVFYDDGDVEVLSLSKEIWEFITDSESLEEKAAGLENSDASPERPQKKKVKSSHRADQVRGSGSSGKSGASSNPKGTVAKSGTKPRDVNSSSGKMKGKAVNKTDDHSGGSRKDRKSGSKAVNVASKTDKRLKDDFIDTPKTSKSKNVDSVTPNTLKTKQGFPRTTARPKQDLPSKSKGKRPRSSGRSDANDDTKLKSGSSRTKENEGISDPAEGPDEVKGKSSQSSKAQLSEPKFGRKRRKVTKS